MEPTEYRGLMAFRKNHPPKFSGDYDPEGARLWLAEIEKIFEAMGCLEEHKVPYATFMLQGEAENWWRMHEQRKAINSWGSGLNVGGCMNDIQFMGLRIRFDDKGCINSA